ncbi:MAG: alpha-glucosidase C-terminal domain-containing protein, partial [Clostridia bacterium]|nr:alpha-glucosidase C-terminal domain-containing protein [Clostridia bacterium]
NWWCEKGIDGFRMDVISLISKVPGLPDGPMAPGAIYGRHNPYTEHGPRVHEFLKEMNQKVLSKYDLLTVGETAGVTVQEAAKYANVDGSELGMVFQFEHVEAERKFGKWTDEPETIGFVRENLTKWQYDLEGKAWNSLFLDNHDQPRAVSHFGNDSEEHREASAKMLATMLHMMQGTPYIYQGQELGMTNYPFTDVSEFRDVESINACHEWVDTGRAKYEEFWPCLVFKSRDNSRTPMQWDDSANAGFTTGTPWINVNPNYTYINAKQQMGDPNSVFSYYKKLLALRKQYDIITYGRYQLIMEDDPQVYAYTRTLENERLLIVCNYSNDDAAFTLPEEFEGAECLIQNMDRAAITGSMQLKPYECFVLYHK